MTDPSQQPPKNADEYRLALQAVVFAANFLGKVNVAAMLDQTERAEAIGPILDPTLYRANGDKMAQDKEMLLAALPLWKWQQALISGDSP